MNSRASRGQRSRDRRRQERQLARRRRLFRKITWLSSIAIVLVAVVAGGIIFAGTRPPAEPEVSSTTGREIGNRTGKQLPDFNMRLVDGGTLNSAELATAEKPAFYFFFATW